MHLASRIEFEELKFRLLAFIVAAEMKLKSWTVKLGRQPEVEEVLDDYNVCCHPKYVVLYIWQCHTKYYLSV